MGVKDVFKISISMWVLFASFSIFSNFYQLDLHYKSCISTFFMKHTCVSIAKLWNRVRPNIGYFLILQAKVMKNIQCNTTSCLFIYYIRYIVQCLIMLSITFCKTTFRVLCLGWCKICRGSQGFSTYNLNIWAFSSVHAVLNHVIIVFLYYLVVLLWSCSCSSCCITIIVWCFNSSSLLYCIMYWQT